MKKLLMLATAATMITGAALAQQTGGTGNGSEESGATSGSASSNGSMNGGSMDAGTSGMSGTSAADTTNAPNAPFLGNRDVIGSFYTDDTMSTVRTGDEFTAAFNAMSQEDRTQVMSECMNAQAGQRPLCDALLDASVN